MSKTTWVPVLLCAAVLASEAPHAQQPGQRPQSAAEVLRGVQQGTDDMEQLQAGLKSPNPSVRVATFNGMVNSNNPALIATAINEGHASSDATLRDLSARLAAKELKVINLQPAGAVPAEQQASYVVFTGGFRMPIDHYDATTGMMNLGGGSAQLSGTRLNYRTSMCQGTLAAVEGTWTYEGTVVCDYEQRQHFTAKMTTALR